MTTAKCHPERRHAARGLCSACYQRKRFQANPEKVRAAKRARHQANPEKVRARVRRWYVKNHDDVRAKARQWHADNAEKRSSYYHNWQQGKPEKRLALNRKRRARQRGATGSGVSDAQWHDVLETFGGACAYCLRTDAPLACDHVEPLVRGGLHDVCNVVPACKRCNSAKGARSLLFFLSTGIPSTRVIGSST